MASKLSKRVRDKRKRTTFEERRTTLLVRAKLAGVILAPERLDHVNYLYALRRVVNEAERKRET